MTLTMVNGELTLKDVLKDYADRGAALERYSLLDFVLNTYEAKVNDDAGNQSERVEYLEGTGHRDRCRVMQKDRHETMPEFIGKWFPKREERETYSAWMLTMLAPWRNIVDLCPDRCNIVDQFDLFLASTSDQNRRFITNSQYFHESMDSASRREKEGACKEQPILGLEDIMGVEDHAIEDVDAPAYPQIFMEKDVEVALAKEFTQDLLLYAKVGMNIAEEAGIFNTKKEMPRTDFARCATREDGYQHIRWDKAINAITKAEAGENIPDHSNEIEPTVLPLGQNETAPSVLLTDKQRTGSQELLLHLEILNTEQRRAHDIVANNLDAHLNGDNPRQVLMTVIGPGGTGKSMLLNAITKTFKARGASHLLSKTAMSGVAASLIGGATLHWWAGLPSRNNPQGDDWMDRSSKTLKKRREENITGKKWLAIDEASMTTNSLLTQLSQVLGRVLNDDG